MPFVPISDDLTAPRTPLGVDQMGPRESIPEPSILGPAFRTQNMIGSFLAAESYPGKRAAEPDHNPLDIIRGTSYEQNYLDRFVGSESEMETRDIMLQIAREERDRERLANAGWPGFLAETAAGTIDPTIAMPGGAIVKSAKGGYAMFRSMASIAGAGAAAVTAQEAALQATQRTRTVEESIGNIGAATVLAGLLGGAVARFATKAERTAGLKALEQIKRELKDTTAISSAKPFGQNLGDVMVSNLGQKSINGFNSMNGVVRLRDGTEAKVQQGMGVIYDGNGNEIDPSVVDAFQMPDGAWQKVNQTPGGATGLAAPGGSAAADTRTLVPREMMPAIVTRAYDKSREMLRRGGELPGVAGKVAGPAGKALAAILGIPEWLIKGSGPLTRMAYSSSVAGKRVAFDLVESPLQFKENEAGAPTTRNGPAVETTARIAIDGTRWKLQQELDRLYQDYYYGAGKAPMFGRARARVDEMRGLQGERLGPKAFGKEVRDAMLANDTHPIPEVEAAAKWLRKEVFDPWKEAAIRLKLLPEDVTVKTAQSYFMRVYDKQRIVAERPKFLKAVTDWLTQDQETKAGLKADLQTNRDLRAERTRTLRKLEKRLETIQKRQDEVEARLSEREIDVERAGKRVDKLQDRQRAARDEMTDLDEVILDLKDVVKDPELKAELAQLQRELADLKRADKPVTLEDLERAEKDEEQGILAGPLRRAARIATGQVKAPKLPSFWGYMAKAGGIKDVGGEVLATVGDKQKVPGLITDTAARDLDAWGEKLTQDFPEIFIDRPSPDDILELLGRSVVKDEPSWFLQMQMKPEDLDAYEQARVIEYAAQQAGIDLKSPADVADMLRNRDARDLDDLTAELDNMAEPERSINFGQHRPTTDNLNAGVASYKHRGDFRVDKPSQLGREAAAYVIREGKSAKGEALLIFDGDGAIHADGVGTSGHAGLPIQVVLRIDDEKQNFAIHHNHPSNRAFSLPDVLVLSRPGVGVVWAHGNNGLWQYRSSIPPTVRGQDKGKVYKAIGSAYKAAENVLYKRLSDLSKAGRISQQTGNEVWSNLTSQALHNAGLIDYFSNYTAVLPPDIGLGAMLAEATQAARKAGEVHLDASILDRARRPNRNSRTVRHVGDMGIVSPFAGGPAGIDVRAPGVDRTRQGMDRPQEGRGEQLSLFEPAGDIESPKFKRWFEGSKVTGKDGTPEVVYHHGSFDETADLPAGAMHFGTKRAAEDRVSGKMLDDALMGVETYQGEDGKWHWDDGMGLTSEEEGIDGWDDSDGALLAGRAELSSQLDTQNMDDTGNLTAAYLSIKNPKRVRDLGGAGGEWEKAIEAAKAQGFDGIVYRNEYEDKGKDSWIAFEPTQIKSVFNKGEFDPSNPNILAEPDRELPKRQKTKEEFDAWVAGIKAENAAAQKEVEAALDKDGAFTASDKDGHSIMVTESLYEPGLYQISQFDANGEPWGHYNVRKEDLGREVKSTLQNRGPNMLSDAERSLPGPTFYSAVLRHVEGLKQSRAPAAQWLATIKAAPGIKKEELEWLGLEDWLKGQEGPVTKEAVADFIRANQIEVKDVVRGGPLRDEIKPSDTASAPFKEVWESNVKRLREIDAETELQYGGQRDPERIAELGREYSDLVAIQDDLHDQMVDATIKEMGGAAPSDGPAKFGPDGNYVLPGGENYRELLLTMPRDKEGIQAEYKRLTDDGVPATEALRQLEDKYPRFKGAHFDEENILAHVRFNERIDADGKRVLFLEEVQSDWHQKGRKQGYDTGEAGKAYDDYLTDLENRFRESATKDAVDGGIDPAQAAAMTENMAEKMEPWNFAKYFGEEQKHKQLWDAKVAEGTNAVPDAPFKTTWPELAMKRMIRWAADNGFDRIAWTPGKVQAERYDLSKQITELTVRRGTDGKYSVDAVLKDDRVPERMTGLEEKDLPDVIGKEMADKAIKDLAGINEKRWYVKNVASGNKSEMFATREEAALYQDKLPVPIREQTDIIQGPQKPPTMSYRGLDLKVGGEGMESFYDRELVNIANKLGKKFGAKVGETRIDTGEKWPHSIRIAHDGDKYWLASQDPSYDDPVEISISDKFNSYEEADDARQKMLGGFTQEAHAIDLPEPMRENSLAGVGMFQPDRELPPFRDPTIPLRIQRESMEEAVNVRRGSVQAVKDEIERFKRYRQTAAGKERLEGARKGEAALNERATRGRRGVLQDRSSRLDTARDLMTRAQQNVQEELDDLRLKAEEKLLAWEGKSAGDAQAALKRRNEYAAERDRLDGLKNEAGIETPERQRLEGADKAVDKAIKRIIRSDRDKMPEEIESLANEIVERILGSPDGRLPYDLPSGGPKVGPPSDAPPPRGPLAHRQFMIPDDNIKDWLVADPEQIAHTYLGSIVPDVLLTERFGDVDMTRQFREINEEYAAKAKLATSERERLDIRAEQERVIGDLAAMRDRIRGTYGFTSDTVMKNAARIAGAAGSINTFADMGGSAISQITDLAGPVFAFGLGQVFKDGWVPFVKNLAEGNKGALQKAKRQYNAMGIAIDMNFNTRNLDEVGEQYHPRTKAERALKGGAQAYMNLNLSAQATDMAKTIAAVVTGNEIFRATKAVAEGKATPKQITNLAASSIDEEMAGRIWQSFNESGAVEDGVFLPNTADWTDDAARRAFEGAVSREVNIQVVTPGQEKALWLSNPILKVLGQFKAFIASSSVRIMAANLQKRDAQTLQGLVTAIALGALGYKAYTVATGQEASDRWQDWVKEGVSRSGVLGWLDEGNAFASKFTRGQLDLYRGIGADKPLSRYASRGVLGALLGPTAGKIENLAQATGALAAGEFTGADTGAARRLLPLQNLFYIRRLLNQVEEGFNDRFGIPQRRQ